MPCLNRVEYWNQARYSEKHCSSAASSTQLSDDTYDVRKRDKVHKFKKRIVACPVQPVEPKTPSGIDSNRGQDSTTKDNPCKSPYTFYLSCGGPEIIYPYPASELEEVANCVPGNPSILQSSHPNSPPPQLNPHPSPRNKHPPPHIFPSHRQPKHLLLPNLQR